MIEENTLLSPLYYPIPCALLSFRNAGGEPQVVSVGWIGVVGSCPARLSVAFNSRQGPAANMLRGAEFAVNLISQNIQQQPECFRRLARRGLVPVEGSGMTLKEGLLEGAPLIEQCPVHIECRQARLHARFGQLVVSGEVAYVHQEGICYGEDVPLDIFRLQPFTLGNARPA